MLIFSPLISKLAARPLSGFSATVYRTLEPFEDFRGDDSIHEAFFGEGEVEATLSLALEESKESKANVSRYPPTTM